MNYGEKDSQKGTIVLESVFAVIVCIIVLMFFISFGFYLYQKSLVSIVANEVAESVAVTYKYKELSDMSAVTKEDISGVGLYRYFFFNADKFNSKAKEKAETQAEAHLSATSLAQRKGSLVINVERVPESFGRAHYKVEVMQPYNFLWGKLLSGVGIDANKPLKAVAYSESVDVLSYTNTVKFTKYISEKSKEIPIVGAADSLLGMAKSVLDAAKAVAAALKH